MANAAIFAVPRNRHLVAVLALLVSSVGAFIPHQQAHAPRHRHHDCCRATAATASVTASVTAVYEAATTVPPSAHSSSFLSRHLVPRENSSGCRRRQGGWFGAEPRLERGWRYSFFEDEHEGVGLGFFYTGGTGSAALRRSRRRDGRWSSRRGESIGSRNAAVMALHFPKFPSVLNHFPKMSPKKPGRKNGDTPKPAGASNTTATSNNNSSSSSNDSNSTRSSQLAPLTVAEGAVKVSTPHKEVASNIPAGHANATKTDLNGDRKTTKKRLPTGGDTPHPPPGKKRVRTAAGAATTSEGKPRKLVKRKRSAGSSSSRGVGAGDGGPAALVVKDDMELEEMMALMKDVLDRVSDNEKELKKFRKELSLTKNKRSEVRDRKFVIDTRAKVMGATFAGSVAGMIVGWSVLPNLWLVGAVAGAVAFAALSRSSSGPVGSFCSTCGIQVALIYKDIRDWWEQTVFLYKTGKLSYTYWRGFEKYDQAWGLTTKYTETMSKLSKEALELDRQYKIRQKTLRAGKRVTTLSRKLGSSAAKEVTTFANNSKSWSTTQLRSVGLMREDPDDIVDDKRKKGLAGLLKLKKGKAGAGSGGGKKARRPLGISLVFAGVFGERQSIYSAPPAGGTRRPGYREDPVIPARIRHLFMTKKQIRDERLQKYRVGFLGMRRSRAFDKDD
ncbi:unnamed protein product [Scytosiphon promiscuus]